MKLSFHISVLFLIVYLMLDVALVDEVKNQRPVVQLVAGLAILSMLFYILVYLKRVKKIFYNWSFLMYWGLFVLLIIGYYSLSLFDLPTEYAESRLRNLAIGFFIYTTIIFTYVGTIKKELKGVVLIILISALFLNGIFEIYNEFTLNTKIRDGVEEINTSAGYVFVMIMPMLMYIYRENYLWVFGMSLVLTMLTGKRGALVIFVVLALYLLFKYGTLKRHSTFNWKTLLFVGVGVLGAFFFYENALESLQHRLIDLSVDNERIGSGRNIIWMNLITYWINTHFAFQLFGSGFYATVGINHQFIAHNDFIEYLIDFGIVGLFLWVLILYKFYRNIHRVKYRERYIYIMLMFCLLILIGRGLFAGTLRTDNIYLSISIGYLLGIYQKKC